jgi:hypothetical protein
VRSDTRIWPSNGRVAHDSLRGQIDGVTFTAGQVHSVAEPLSDLLNSQGRRERQLLLGEQFRVLETVDGLAFGLAERDGYVGYLAAEDLRPALKPTHRVSARATHLYDAADLKGADQMTLSFGAHLSISKQDGRFGLTAQGLYVPMVHLVPVDYREPDPVSVAERLLGTPYLWGGNSAFGIDCSGLVQICHLGTGLACPGDADLQEAALGKAIPLDEPVQRGDLFFWKGHVGMAASPTTLIHANAFHMAVALEDLETTLDRIKARGDGPVTSRRRITPGE